MMGPYGSGECGGVADSFGRCSGCGQQVTTTDARCRRINHGRGRIISNAQEVERLGARIAELEAELHELRQDALMVCMHVTAGPTALVWESVKRIRKEEGGE